MKKLKRDVLLADQASVEALLGTLPVDDVLGRSSFESRLGDIREELQKLGNEIDVMGSVALMFGGPPVQGSRAIDAEFATKTLDNFHALVSKQVARNEVGALGGRGPIPTHAEARLAITEILRGSVGFLLEERSENTQLADTAVKMAIHEVSDLISKSAAESDVEFEQAIETLDHRLILSLRDFFKTLDEHGASIRIVEDERDSILDAKSIQRARLRVDDTWFEDRESDLVVGELLGILPAGRRFEMKLADTGEVIRGAVAAASASKYVELIEGPTGGIVGRTWRVKMRIREVRERNKPPRNLYTLIGLLEQVGSNPTEG
jgi:hypothetical protein